MTLTELLKHIQHQPGAVQFNDVMEVIASNYDYQPVGFRNGVGDNAVINHAGSNEGSCKLFAFAMLHKLDEQQTLSCFGDYYRNDVLKHPDSDNHANIRAFMRHGWSGIEFSDQALTAKS